MAQSKKPSQLSVRFEDRELLEAVAYEWGLERNIVESTTDKNLSALLRQIIEDYLQLFCKRHGGREAVIARYDEARASEARALLDELMAKSK